MCRQLGYVFVYVGFFWHVVRFAGLDVVEVSAL